MSGSTVINKLLRSQESVGVIDVCPAFSYENRKLVIFQRIEIQWVDIYEVNIFLDE
ncbi:MAG: hypothetical protein AB4080_26390 [Trichodesmium sp.]